MAFACPMCKKAFPKTSMLQQHQHDTQHAIFPCPDCERVFYSQRSLQQHRKSVKHPARKVRESSNPESCRSGNRNPNQKKMVHCTECAQEFATIQSMEQHRRNKHHQPVVPSMPQLPPATEVTDFQPESSQSNGSPKPVQIHEGIVEKLPLREGFVNKIRQLFHRRKVLVLDEMLGDGTSFRSLENLPYEVTPLPAILKGFSDRDIRLALAQQGRGLVTKDFEMALLAFKMGISPVYFLAEKRGNIVLIRLSRANLQFVKSSDPLKEGWGGENQQ